MKKLQIGAGLGAAQKEGSGMVWFYRGNMKVMQRKGNVQGLHLCRNQITASHDVRYY